MLRKNLIFLFLLFSFRIYSQHPEISFDRLSIKEGLADHSTNCITQDHKGFIWIGGSNGLYRYDGYDFISYQYQPGNRTTQYFKDVYRIEEDKRGLLWILSEMGIVLFDPESGRSILLKLYSFEKKSAEYDYSPDLLIDKDGSVWATFRNGALKISPDDELVELIRSDKPFYDNEPDILQTEYINLPEQLKTSENYLTSLCEDRYGNILAGSVSGLFLLDKTQKNLITLVPGRPAGSQEGLRHIRSISQARDKSYWIAAGKYLYNFFLDTDPAAEINISAGRIKKYIVGDNQVPTSLLIDSRNNFFVGTIQGIYSVKTRPDGSPVFRLLDSNKTDPEFYGYAKTIRDIFEDWSGVIWTAQDYYGITKFNPDRSRFITYKNLIIENFRGTDINPIFKDKEGNIWIGTYGGGLYQVKAGSYKVKHYDMFMQKNNIICMTEIKPGIFLLGTDRGVIEFDCLKEKSRQPSYKALDDINSDETLIMDILKDDHFIYIASFDGLFLFDLKSQKLQHYVLLEHDSLTVVNNQALSVLKLKNGNVLAGTAAGIYLIRPESGPEISRIIDNRQLIDNGIFLDRRHRIFEDSNGEIWITDYAGLHKLNLTTLEINNFKLFDKIEYPIAWSVTEDDNKNLWIGTHFGLVCFNTKSQQTKVYSAADGLPITIHGLNSVYKDADGRFFFGGIGGFYNFYPDSLRTVSSVPPVAITDILLFNKSIRDPESGSSHMYTDISGIRTLKLPYNQNDITIKFSALDYNHPADNQYLYKLEGYQDSWVRPDPGDRTAGYLKLKPWKYTFRVKGSNSDGIWNVTGASLEIVIRKPWWSTGVALSVYLIISVLTIIGIFRWRLHVLTKEREALESQVKIRTREINEQKQKISEQKDLLEQQNLKIKEEEELKSRLFSNISHEFRTPLALIKGPAEELLEKSRLGEKEKTRLKMINRNAARLLNLVNQLLDISRFESNKMILEISEGDIMNHLYNIAVSFTPAAEAKSIDFRRHIDERSIVTWFDPDKIEKIAVNILSNAFKYTPVGGQIDFSARYIQDQDQARPGWVQFSVKDSGPGIPEYSLDKIFDRFYQVQGTTDNDTIGTGIGLSLSQDLAKLMHGDISVKSRLNSGSVFTVKIPVGKDHLEADEYIVVETKQVINRYYFDSSVLDVGTDEYEPVPDHDESKPDVLIVDDNSDLRNQLSDSLRSKYFIKTAVDGISGMKKALEFMPDLIITDLMMPGIDGMELCRSLKENEITSHIPIIMLTAKDTLPDKISGLQSGADDYIPKPFNMNELKARVENLIEQRRKLRERFSRELTLEPSAVTVTSADEKFITRAVSLIESRMKDEAFNLNEFQNMMNLSRSTLFRKISALTGQSPTEFIRTIRLKRAADLIRQNFGNISEISAEVGFTNISYFNRSFKKFFGVSPREYALRSKDNNL